MPATGAKIPAAIPWGVVPECWSSGKQTKSRIFQAFGINPLIVGEIEGANRAQAVVAESSFASNVVNPLLILMGQVLTAWVAPRFARPSERLTAWFAPVVARDDELDSRNWNAAAGRGVVTINECRRHLLNLPDVPWGDEPVASGGGPMGAASVVRPSKLAYVGGIAANLAQQQPSGVSH